MEKRGESMKKSGFTLAEILITLGIIGVISALVIPQFVGNTYDQANASKLSSIVADYENIFGHMLLREDRENIFDTAFGMAYDSTNINTTDVRDALEQYTTISRIGNLGNVGYTLSYNSPFMPAAIADTPQPPVPPAIQTVHIYDINGTQVNPDPEFSVLTPGGAVLMFNTVVSHEYAPIFIDVNGGSAPNRYGRDIFAFILGQDGHLYPSGSREAARIIGNDTFVWNSSSGTNDTRCNEGTTYNGLGCTARLIENNYKMDY